MSDRSSFVTEFIQLKFTLPNNQRMTGGYVPKSVPSSDELMAIADQIMLDDWDRRFKNLYGQDPVTLLGEPSKKEAPPRSPSPISLSKHRFC